jgi:hypothetical protein
MHPGAKDSLPYRTLLLGILSLFWILISMGCGPIPEETAHQKALKDSAAADSIMRIEADKIKTFEGAKKRFNDSVKASLKALKKAQADSLADSTIQLAANSVLISKTKKDSAAHSIKKTKDSSRRLKPRTIDTGHKKIRKIKDSLHSKRKSTLDTLR